MKNQSYQVTLGSGVPLAEQLKGYLPATQLRQFDGLSLAITRLYVAGLLTEDGKRKARARLFQRIDRAINSKPRKALP